jgi:DNA-binding SARP family transcriptional activator/ABC-type branched-subunit amino acid transport system substrate-binding protein/DNA-binding beta-propeller fold protein YncE
MRYCILGPLEVQDGLRAVPLAQGRQRVLLAVLLLHANEAVSSDRLIDALWGESPPPSAVGSLHNLVSGLRQGVCDRDLVTQGRGYLLRVADGELDAQRFEALVERGRAALARGDADRAVALLREGLGLWRGRALADLAYEAALQADAARLEDRRLAALEERIDADLACGRHGDLVGELDALTAQHPLRERFRGQQMLALYRSGRQADALQVYRDARRHLLGELGIEPGPELRRLERAVLDQDPALGAGDALPPAPRLRPSAVARARRQPVALIATGAVLLVATGLVVLLLAGGPGSEQSGLTSVAGDSLAAIDPATNRVVAEVPIGATPTSVTAGAGAVWALNADDQTIARIDPRTKSVKVFGVGATPTDLAAGTGTLWVGSGVAGAGDIGVVTSRLLRVDGDSQTVRARIELPAPRLQGPTASPGQLAVGAGTVWALNGGGELARVDPRSGRVTATVRSLRAKSIAPDAGSVWAIAADGTTVARIDARAAAVRARVRIPAARLDAIAAGAGAVWVADAYGGNLWRIDPGPKVVTRTIPVGVGADGVAVGAGAVWVINSLRGTVARVDPRRNRVTATVAVGNTPRDVDVGAGAVWVTLAGGARPVPAAAAPTAQGPRPLPQPPCDPVFAAAASPPDYLIASDLPLQSGPLQIQPVANAVAFVLRQHRFRAGRYRIGYQSCDASTADSGGSDPRKCAANAKAYAGNRALLGVVGPYESGCAAVEIPILNRAPGGPLAMISPSNSYVGLTHVDPTAPRGALGRLYPTGVRNYARIYPSDDVEAAADALLARQLGLRRVYVLDDGDPYGRELALHFVRSAQAIGLHIAGTARWNPNGTRLQAVADRVRRARADGAFLSGFLGSNGGELTSALRARLGRRFSLIAPDAFGPMDFLMDSSRGAAEGMYVSVGGLPGARLGERGQTFMREFGATQPGLPVGRPAVHAAAATEILLDAIARSDGTRASVSRELMGTRLDDAILGAVRFDSNGDLVAPAVTILRVHQHKRASNVEGFEGAAIDRIIAPPANGIR